MKAEFNQLYQNYYQTGLNSRYITLSDIENLWLNTDRKYELIGESILKKPIYKLTIGNGPVKVLLWSQMHGNESTGTRAMMDIWQFLESDNPMAKQIVNQLEIHYIPILNPDGAEVYSRRNAAGIDMNRDYNSESSPEIRCLKKEVFNNDYKCIFNLHDQRSIFNIENTQNPSTLAFLSPSINIERTINNTRKKAMGVVNYICKSINSITYVNTCSRFTDEFYPNATGDNFQKAGIPCVLIESGHYNNDYNREITRKFTFFAILYALEFITTHKDLTVDYEDYNTIPMNCDAAYDIIYRNITVELGQNKIVGDLGIRYQEELNRHMKNIDFKAKIQEFGDLSQYFGYLEYQAENRVFQSGLNKVPRIGEMAHFELGDWKVENGSVINL